MSKPNLMKITNGIFALALVDTSAVDYDESWQAPAGANVDEVDAADYPGSAGFACQITSGTVTTSPNVTTTNVEPTWCEPGSSESEVAESSFGFDVAFFQDPHIVAGLSRFLFENDTREAYAFIGMAGLNPPRAIGRVKLVAGAIAGAGRTNLAATVSLPFSRKPTIEFGDATDSVIVNAPGLLKSAAKPTDAFDTEPTITASDSPNAAKLTGLGYIASPQSAWTTGQAITIGGLAFNWSGSAWAAGIHA